MERASAASLSAPQRPRLGCTGLSFSAEFGWAGPGPGPCSSCLGSPAGVSESRNVSGLLGIREPLGLLLSLPSGFLS